MTSNKVVPWVGLPLSRRCLGSYTLEKWPFAGTAPHSAASESRTFRVFPTRWAPKNLNKLRTPHCPLFFATAYTQTLQGVNVQISMTDVGAAWQNGYAEHLIRTIKEEEVDLSEYIEYNNAYRQLGRFLNDVYTHTCDDSHTQPKVRCT